MKTINSFIKKHISKIILIFLFIQPILDLITSYELNIVHTEFSTGSIVRLTFLLFMIYYSLFISKNKKLKILTIISVSYLALFSALILYVKGSTAIVFEFKNALNTFYLIFALISLKSSIIAQSS